MCNSYLFGGLTLPVCCPLKNSKAFHANSVNISISDTNYDNNLLETVWIRLT